MMDEGEGRKPQDDRLRWGAGSAAAASRPIWIAALLAFGLW